MNPALPVDEESPILDLRSWLEQVRQLGKLKEVQGASWDLEVGTLTDLNVKSRKWTLLFDEIQDYPPGYRVVTGSLLDSGRVALSLGFSPPTIKESVLSKWGDLLG